MISKPLTVIILAAGQGQRMRTHLPKVLHPVAGSPMLQYVIAAAQESGAYEVRVVVGYKSELVTRVVEYNGAVAFHQDEPKGTGYAVMSAGLESIMEGYVMIFNGDHPLLMGSKLKSIYKEFLKQKADLALVTSELDNPGVLGRIVRHDGKIRAVVEAKDASQSTLGTKEVNTGIYIVKSTVLKKLLPNIQPHNKAGEYYLTDLVSLSCEHNYKVIGIKDNVSLAVGVNTQKQLAEATKVKFTEKVEKLMENGVIIIDPRATYIEPEVEVGAATVIYPGTYLKGKTHIGDYCVIEPNVFVSDSKIGNEVKIKAGSYLEKCEIHKKATIGPYARLRPETVIEEEAKVGNFVEMKKVKFGKKSKASHLSYLGDADIGNDVNIGCGTITCNYAVDKKKHKTIIEDNVFVGSDAQFVAPVKIGKRAVIGAGSTITKDVPEGALSVSRGSQIIKENYKSKN